MHGLWLFGIIVLFISLIFFKVKHEINYEGIRTILGTSLIVCWSVCYIIACIIIFSGTLLYDGLINLFVKILKKDPKKFKPVTRVVIDLCIDLLHNR